MLKLRVFQASVIVVVLSLQGAAAATLPLIQHAHRPGGQSAATSVKQWAQWAFSFNNVVDGGNPVTDTTGAFQNRKQTFPVVQLGGTVTTDIKRKFTAPAGKPFAIPIFAGTCLGNDAVGTCIGDDTIKDYIDDTKSLYLSIDGNVIINAKNRRAVDRIASKYRVNTGIFGVDLAPNNWVEEVNGYPPPGCSPADCPPLLLQGQFPESYADGFFAFADLAAGRHTVVFAGTSFSEALGGRVMNRVRAEITVAPVPVPAALPLYAAAVVALGFVARRRHRASA